MVTPVAVIGMACRLPGGINSPDQLWEALLRGDDLVTEIPADRWDADEYYDPERGVPGRTVSRWGAFIDDPGAFDASFFGFDDKRATAIDPQHRLLMETSWEAIEQAGIDPTTLAGTRAGVYFGISHDDHTSLALDAGVYGYTETSACMASGRVAYLLDVRGPAMTTDTACSSGLLAVHMAARSLATGESDLALAGGCEVMREPRKNIWASAQGMLSPTGRCKPFDEAADGFVRSEGCAVVLLKRLPDALRDGDRVLAVVRGTAANSDGRTRNIATPSVQAQVAACRAALEVAGVDPDTVGAVEAHGTGTPVGDPIEFTSLATTYGANGTVLLGSAKSNFGHAEAAAGALGFVKAVLEVRHGVVPPMVHFHRMPEALAQIATGLVVPQEVTPWPPGHGDVRRIAVSSYGISGTNVHAIVEQAPATQPTQAEGEGAPGPKLFALSSTSPEGLRDTAGRLAEWIEQQHVSLDDLGYTLARRRAHRPVRTAVIADGVAELTRGLRAVADGDTPYRPAVGQDDRGPVWVFSGQGSQWAAMGAELLLREPEFAAEIARIEPLIADEAGFSVTEALTAPEVVTGIDRVQPALFAMQVALAAAMRAHGVRPGAVIGHSMGEVAAAVVAGALSLADGVRVICRRSRLLARIAGAGAMASVELPVATVREQLSARGVADVVVSVVTSPASTVVGGDTGTVRDLVAGWERRGVMAREVAVDVASHSPQVDPILGELADSLAGLTPAAPAVPFYSATREDPRAVPDCGAVYWVDNLRQMVRFSAAVTAALEDGYRVFAELSPHPLLARAVEQTGQALDTPVQTVAAVRREQPMPDGLLAFLSDLHAAGAAVDFSVLYPGGRLVDVPLPTWTHHRLLLERTAGNRDTDGGRTVVVHPLLGEHVRLPEQPERHAWAGDVGTAALPWLGDHQVHGVAAMPGAGFCEMALAAARTVLGRAAEVRDIRFEEMLLLDERTALTATAEVQAPGLADFEVDTDDGGERTRRAVAVLRTTADSDADAPHRDVAALFASHPTRVDGAELRGWFEKREVSFGPAFAGLAAVYTGDESTPSVLAEVRLPGPVRSQQGAYVVHPALLDACFQSVAAHPVVRAAGDQILLPLSVGLLRAHRPARDAHYCYTEVRAGESGEFEADLDVLDEAGAVLMTVRGLRVGSGVATGSDRDRLLGERLLTVDWEQRDLSDDDAAEARTWLLITTSGEAEDALATGLVKVLNSAGAECKTLNWAQSADHPAAAEQLGGLLRAGVNGVVVLTPPPLGEPDDQGLLRGREQVRHLVRITRELPDFAGDPPRLYVVTRGAQSVLPGDRANLDQAGLRGLLRVIGAEHPQLGTTHIDVDDLGDPEQLAAELLADSGEDETAWRGGRRYAARLRLSPLRPEERRTAVVEHGRSDNGKYAMRLQIRAPGDLQTLELAAVNRTPPGPEQIEVAVRASSVNFADVLVAMGRFPSVEGGQPELGMDFAGVVTAVGPDVTAHRVGDHVGGFSRGGCWGTFITVAANLAVTLPPGMTAEQAAALSSTYGTAWYGLHDLAGIGPGDKVLIHSATGGVGQAAIAIARRAGAQIFATAGSEARRELLREMGIERVYDSRSTEFAELIRRDTDGYGVDIVLNSLTGAAQRAGLELLAVGGRFVEIGKLDVYTNARLGLYPFRRNLTFYYVDLALMCQTHPDRLSELLATVYRLVAEGELPPAQSTAYPIAEAATAIRVMSAAQHTGKLILAMPDSGSSSVVVPPEQARVFRGDGAYIITGGLGGLGLFLAGGMALAGCGRIVLTGRSQPNARAEKAIARIRATGADIAVECGNIAEPETAARLVATATATGLPVRGVLHAAAVVEDATLTNITDELIDRDWSPKAHGAWHLHRATTEQPLDWFCSFSSAAALLGSPGQGAYAAANSWLDAFTLWRHRQGLAASAIAWGAWEEIGRAASLTDTGRTTMITPEQGAYAFQRLLRYDRVYSGYLPIAGAQWLAPLIARSPFAEALRAVGGQGADETASVRAELRSLPPDEWPVRLGRLITEQVGVILRRSVDPDRPFAEHGLDSLGNLELRTRIETETGIRLTPKAIAAHNTARALARHLSEALSAESG
ncbi:MAG: type I polyketide synthase [Mycobacterium sp.]|nr:type I polyketide synthase [Mycobacterium sp.]